MQPAGTWFPRLVLVCTNERTDGRESCGPKGGVELHRHLKEAIKQRDPRIRVSRSGCLDNCKTGPTVVIMPDNIWLGGVTEEDIPRIVAYLGGDEEALADITASVRQPAVATEAGGCCGGGCCST